MTQTLRSEPLATGHRPGGDEVDGVVTCREIIDITHDVKSFVFDLPGGWPLAFRPGQYLTFTFPFTDPVTGQPVERCYSLSSPPSSDATVTITVKRVPGGPVSTWLHERLRVGDELRTVGPFGEFSHANHRAEKYVFFSAGSGITPLMSMTRALCASTAAIDVVFVHSARTPADIIFRDELEVLWERPGLSVVLICEDDAPDEVWGGPRGRLSAAMLQQLVPDVADRVAFTCGPPPYMESVRGLLTEAGVAPSARHEETFQLGGSLQPDEREPAGGRPEAGRAFTVEFRRSGRVIECDPGTTLLDSAVEAGLSLASSCEEGVCGTCKLQLLCGQVDMRHGGGIRPREIANNMILPCCSTPLGDLTLDA